VYQTLVSNTNGFQIPRQEADGCPDGLVHSLKSDRKAFPVKISSYARMMEVHIPSKKPRTPRGKRQKINEFSASSRRNMLKTIHKIRHHENGFFATLTYDGFFNRNPERCKADLAAFRKRLARRFPDAGGLWRMELKRRKSGDSEGVLVPHYHVLLFGIKPDEIQALPLGEDSEEHLALIQRLRLWLSRIWNEIIHGSIKHLKAGTNLRRLESMRHAASYVSKYVAKPDEETPNEDEAQFWGRRWGTFGKLDLSVVMTISIPYEDVPAFKRMLRSLLIGRSRKREIEAKTNGKKYRHKKSRGYWRARSMNKQTQGCSMFGFGDCDRELLTKMLFVLIHS